MGPMGNGDTGGNGVKGIGHMGNETHRGKEVWGGMGHMANKAHRVQGTGGMGHMGNRPQWV